MDLQARNFTPSVTIVGRQSPSSKPQMDLYLVDMQLGVGAHMDNIKHMVRWSQEFYILFCPIL
jgi:hypothetical protein